MCLTQIYTPRVGIHEHMSNRVEDLERQVAELQAAVNGLTEELVEMKERVRQVEDAQEVSIEAERSAAETTDDGGEASDTASDTTGGERRTHSDDHVEVVERTDPATGGSDESTADAATDADEDDMVVPEQEATTPDAGDAASKEGTDETSNDESDGNDIIVA